MSRPRTLLASLLLTGLLLACGRSNEDEAATTVMLVVGKSGGLGRVTSSPAGIDCGSQCSQRYPKGSRLQLSAAAETGHRFLGWSGDCEGESCALVLDGDRSVTARFEPVAPAVEKACDDYPGPALDQLRELRGSLHLHSSYSDNPYPSRPSDYFGAVRAAGLDFAGSAEHSENEALPITLSEKCLDPELLLNCIGLGEPDILRKWAATGEQAAAATEAGRFTAFRGFEWSSDRFGHINVFFSQHSANDKLDGGYALSMAPFQAWLNREPALLGGGDGLAVFNHPGDKKFSADDSAFNWNHLEYLPELDERIVAMELYNGGPGPNGSYPGYYLEALSKGWHLGAVAAEDKHNLDWGQAYLAKTVFLATGNSEAEIKAALQARRSYAQKGLEEGEKDLRLSLDAEGQPMGSRLRCEAGKTVPLRVAVRYADGSAFTGSIQLLGAEGRIHASTQGGELAVALPVPTAEAGESWYFVRVDDAAGTPLAYSSPVWLRAR